MCHEKETGRADVLAFVLWTTNPRFRGVKAPRNQSTRPVSSVAGLEEVILPALFLIFPAVLFYLLAPHLWVGEASISIKPVMTSGLEHKSRKVMCCIFNCDCISPRPWAFCGQSLIIMLMASFDNQVFTNQHDY